MGTVHIAFQHQVIAHLRTHRLSRLINSHQFFGERPTLLLIFKPVVNIGIILLADKLFFVKVHIEIPVIIQKIDFSLIASDYSTKKVLKRMMNLYWPISIVFYQENSVLFTFRYFQCIKI